MLTVTHIFGAVEQVSREARMGWTRKSWSSVVATFVAVALWGTIICSGAEAGRQPRFVARSLLELRRLVGTAASGADPDAPFCGSLRPVPASAGVAISSEAGKNHGGAIES